MFRAEIKKYRGELDVPKSKSHGAHMLPCKTSQKLIEFHNRTMIFQNIPSFIGKFAVINVLKSKPKGRITDMVRFLDYFIFLFSYEYMTKC